MDGTSNDGYIAGDYFYSVQMAVGNRTVFYRYVFILGIDARLDSIGHREILHHDAICQ